MTADKVLNDFTIKHAFALVREVSGDAQEAREALVSLVGDPLSEDGDQSHQLQEGELGEVILSSLGAAGVIVTVDWAEGLSSSREVFVEMFAVAGIDASKCGEHLLTMKEPPKGEALGVVYLEFRGLAATHGLCVLDLNEGSDAYQLTLVPVEIASRWAGVRVDDGLKVYSGDQVFADALRRSGLPVDTLVNSKDCDPPELSVETTFAPGF